MKMAKLKLADGTEIEAFTREEVDGEIGGLKTKVDELLKEKKTVSARAAELEEAARAADEARQKEKGEFKELYEREQKAKQELADKFGEFQGKIQKNEISIASTSIATLLTKDTGRAELLAEKAAQFAKYTETGVIYELGGVQVDANKLAEHLKSKYPFLADGTGAAGGGAAGGFTSGGAGKKFGDYTSKELSDIRKADPAKYEQIRQTR